MKLSWCVAYLQVVQQRAAEAHLAQRHVWVAAVQKTLDLSADVHSQGLSSLDLGGSQGGPRVVELLQPVLNTTCIASARLNKWV